MNKSKKINLNDKVAIITGGAGLLGMQHALALLECGTRVIIVDINAKAIEKTHGELTKKYFKMVDSLVMDVTDITSIKKAEDEIYNKYGTIDILINNAAIDPKVDNNNQVKESSRFENFSKNQWDFELSVGLTGAFLCSQVFGNCMADNGGGVILNIASDLSVIAPDQRLYRKKDLSEEMQSVKPITYSVIKTGLIGLTRYLAAYWADKKIRVNALSPGGVYNNQADDFVSRLSDLIPMNRMAKVDEYHGAIQFLCSDLSSYMTGQNIVIDGGRSIL
jgi:NAD(P)-dependent dehydrogenase (short-subunit alcohol dehydrogenase family)